MMHALKTGLLRLLRDRAGNVAVVAAITAPVLLGAFGIGAEAASWFNAKRAMQNAADAAAIAAATNAGDTYDVEAKAVTAQYGYKDGSDGVTVAASNTVACPAGVDAGETCYSVTISRPTPLLLAQMVGYQGDLKVNGSPEKMISATAIAVQGTSTRPYCLLTLGTSGSAPALQTNGAPKADFSGCNVMSNNGADCNGHNLKADVGDAYGTNSGCGVVKHSNVDKAADPYANLADNIPDNPCNTNYPTNTYPQEPAKKGTWTPRPDNIPSGSVGWSGSYPICGDVQLQGDVTLTNDTTVVIYNGQLDLNGHTLSTASGVGATIVFAGSNGSYIHAPTGGGTLNIAAPTSGDWSGMAVYQAPNLNTGVDIDAAGNSPTWDISGAVYLPGSDVTFSGAVNKSSNGKSCFVMVANTVLINGTASIFAHGECDKAGLEMPTGLVPARGKLVQ
jgi:hypothetical protein